MSDRGSHGTHAVVQRALLALGLATSLTCGRSELVLGAVTADSSACPQGCDDGDPCTADRCDDGRCQHAPLDRDHDGHLPLRCGGDDCDDRDPAIHPLATEGPTGTPTCGDGRDNDCDGAVDALDSACQRGAGLCTADGFCWVSPTPTGNTLNAAWGSGPDDVWLVGEEGTILHWDGAGLSGLVWPEQLVQVARTQGLSIGAAWGSGPDDVWLGADFGRLLHWDGRGLTRVELPFCLELPWSAVAHLWGFEPGEPWLLCDASLWRRHNDAWIELPGPPELLKRVRARAPDEVWGLGALDLYRWDGAAWLAQPPPPAAPSALWPSSPEDVWVGGRGDDNAALLQHFDGRSWSAYPLAGERDVLDLWGAAPGEVWALTRGTFALHRWDGDRWGAAGAQAWGAGHLWSADGVDLWTFGRAQVARVPRQAPATAQQLVAAQAWSVVGDLAGAGPADLWLCALGTNSAWRWDGAAWTEHDSHVDLPSAIWAWLPDAAWIVGTNSIGHWDGQRWQAADGGPPGWYQAVHGSGPDDVWAVAYDGVIARFDGSAWRQFAAPAEDDFTAVWAFAPSNAWVVGQSGVWQWDGETWLDRRQDNGPSGSLWASLWGLAPDDLWLAEGAVYHWDGAAWSLMPATRAFPSALSRVGGAASDQVWLGGRNGLVLRWDGAAAHEVRSGLSQFDAVDRLWVAPGGAVWISSGASVLRRTP